jgi:hypothetical protein
MKNDRRVLGGIALLVLATTGSANAQAPNQNPNLTPGDDKSPAACPAPPATCPAPEPAPPPQAAPAPAPEPVAQEPTHYEHEQDWVDMYGFAISAGGGVEDFSGSSMRSTTGTGGSWNVRATLGTRSYLAVEGLYIGSAQTINRLGLESNSYLVGNGAQADIRLNATTTYPIQPFIYGGGAWKYYSLSNTAVNVSDVNNHTNVFELPAGVGIAGKYEGLLLDARGEYRWSWGGDLIPNGTGGHLDMSRWGVSGNIGYEF